MTSAYRHFVEAAVPTRQAAALLGLSRTTIYRKPAAPVDHEPVVPPNKLCAAERAEILAALNSPEFVDLAPLQVYAKLLDEGIYLGSVSTFYRVLQERSRYGARPAGQAPGPGHSGTGRYRTWSGAQLGYYEAGWPGEGQVLRLLPDGGHPFEVHRRRARARHRSGGPGSGSGGSLSASTASPKSSTPTAGPR